MALITAMQARKLVNKEASVEVQKQAEMVVTMLGILIEGKCKQGFTGLLLTEPIEGRLDEVAFIFPELKNLSCVIDDLTYTWKHAYGWLFTSRIWMIVRRTLEEKGYRVEYRYGSRKGSYSVYDEIEINWG